MLEAIVAEPYGILGNTPCKINSSAMKYALSNLECISPSSPGTTVLRYQPLIFLKIVEACWIGDEGCCDIAYLFVAFAVTSL